MSDDNGGAPSNLGNFKGVMLCNRPAQIPQSYQAAPGAVNTISGSRPPFSSAVVPESALGLRHLRKPHERKAVPKNKGDDVTWRHKKWLQEFQAQRSHATNEQEQNAIDREENRKRFQDRSAAMRAAIRQIQAHGGDPAAVGAALDSFSGTGELSNVAYAPSTVIPSGDMSSYASDVGAGAAPTVAAPRPRPSAASMTVANSGRPAWALTEEAFHNREEDEAADLVDFAQNLNYDNYMSDMEVREAVKFVKTKVSELELQKQHEEEEAKAAAEEAEYQAYLASLPPEEKVVVEQKRAATRPVRTVRAHHQMHDSLEPLLSSSNGNEFGRPPPTPARDVLDSNQAIRHVHSTASMNRIMDNERANGISAVGSRSTSVQPGVNDETVLRLSRAGSAIVGSSAAPVSLAVPQPVISIIKDRVEPRAKVDPSNLPFLHRHPAV